jgi:nicotinamide-nucleotide amidase
MFDDTDSNKIGLITQQIAERLKHRGEMISIAESSTGGLISASLLATPGASAFFLGGTVVYTLASRRAFLDIDKARVKDLKPLTQEMVAEFASAARRKLDATWGLAELGATGPAASPYGHAAGTSVVGVSGPIDRNVTISTGSDDRGGNMTAFTLAALSHLLATLQELD